MYTFKKNWSDFMLKNFLVREMKKSERKELEIFLYKAIFIPEGIEPPPHEIIFFSGIANLYKKFWLRRGRFLFCNRRQGIATALMKKLLEKIFAEELIKTKVPGVNPTTGTFTAPQVTINLILLFKITFVAMMFVYMRSKEKNSVEYNLF